MCALSRKTVSFLDTGQIELGVAKPRIVIGSSSILRIGRYLESLIDRNQDDRSNLLSPCNGDRIFARSTPATITVPRVSTMKIPVQYGKQVNT